MNDVKIGLNQTSKPAPLPYRRFENAWFMIFMPGISSFLMAVGLEGKAAVIAAAAVVFSGVFVKGLGMVLGNGQIYSPSNQVVDDQKN